MDTSTSDYFQAFYFSLSCLNIYVFSANSETSDGKNCRWISWSFDLAGCDCLCRLALSEKVRNNAAITTRSICETSLRFRARKDFRDIKEQSQKIIIPPGLSDKYDDHYRNHYTNIDSEHSGYMRQLSGVSRTSSGHGSISSRESRSVLI